MISEYKLFNDGLRKERWLFQWLLLFTFLKI